MSEIKKSISKLVLSIGLLSGANISWASVACGTETISTLPTAYGAGVTSAMTAAAQLIANASASAGSAVSASVNNATIILSKIISDNTKALLTINDIQEKRQAQKKVLDELTEDFYTPPPVKKIICENAKDAQQLRESTKVHFQNYAEMKTKVKKVLKEGKDPDKALNDIIEEDEHVLSPMNIYSLDATKEEKEKTIQYMINPFPPKSLGDDIEKTPGVAVYKAVNRIRSVREEALSEVPLFIASLNQKGENGEPSKMEKIGELVYKNSVFNENYQAHLQFLGEKDLLIEILKQVSIGNTIQYFLNQLESRELVMDAVYYGSVLSERQNRELSAIKRRIDRSVRKSQ